MKKLLLCFAACYLALSANLALARNICDRVSDGTQSQVVLVGMDRGYPIYQTVYTPRYRTDCYWKYGAFAFNPQTRAYNSAWNYDDPNTALAKVNADCSGDCTAYSYSEDYSWVAMSENGAWAYSKQNADDAISQCDQVNNGKCAAIWGTSSTADTVVWGFKAIAFDPKTGNHVIIHEQKLSKGEAESAAMAACATPDCWAYAYQGGAGAIAMSSDGRLWGAWTADTIKGAANNVEQYCKKETGDDACKAQVASDIEGLAAHVKWLDNQLKSSNVAP